MIFGKKVITWSKIGEIDGNDLYLCDTVFEQSEFGETNEYECSTVRNRCRELYDECFSDEERDLLVNHPELGDPVFLLRKEEYFKYEDAIKLVNSRWWLRSPGFNPPYAAFVDFGGGVYHGRVDRRFPGLRPAILLKKEN